MRHIACGSRLWTGLLCKRICPASNLSRLWLLQTWQTEDYLTPGRQPGPSATFKSACACVANNFMAVQSAGHPLETGCYQKTVVALCAILTKVLTSHLHHSCTSCSFQGGCALKEMSVPCVSLKDRWRIGHG